MQIRLLNTASKFGDIGACNEGTASADHQHCVCRIVRKRPGNTVIKTLPYAMTEGIHRWVINSENSYALFQAVIDHIRNGSHK